MTRTGTTKRQSKTEQKKESENDLQKLQIKQQKKKALSKNE